MATNPDFDKIKLAFDALSNADHSTHEEALEYLGYCEKNPQFIFMLLEIYEKSDNLQHRMAATINILEIVKGIAKVSYRRKQKYGIKKIPNFCRQNVQF